jgi:hypothetical protein
VASDDVKILEQSVFFASLVAPKFVSVRSFSRSRGGWSVPGSRKISAESQRLAPSVGKLLRELTWPPQVMGHAAKSLGRTAIGGYRVRLEPGC